MNTFDLSTLAHWLQQTAPNASLRADSRQVQAGEVFVALSSTAEDAAERQRHLAHAIEQGAAAVLLDAASQDLWQMHWRVPHQLVPGLAQQIGPLMRLCHGAPDKNMLVVAVTGTNGKTSCSQWLGSTLSQAVGPTGVIGTLGTGRYDQGVAGDFDSTGYTTPDALALQRIVAAQHAAGVQALALEASSIGLDQGRLNGLHVDVAVLTNFSRDHLDYHGDMATYEAAKLRLFDWPSLRHAVINLDDAFGRRLKERLQAQQPQLALTGYSIAGNQAEGVALIQASEIRSLAAGTSFVLETPQGSATVKTQLIGDFNVSNVLAVVGVLLEQGYDLASVVRWVEKLQPAVGRMQQLGGQDAPLVVIDYAHTPDALEKALTTLQPIARQRHGKLWCVFGCGGDRDSGKRAPMGQVAAATADQVIVTSDNPRSEALAAINAQILEGVQVSGLPTEALQVIEDRAAAILAAVKHAARADVVLVAGKGHEDYQEISGRKQPFLDANHAALALAARVTRRAV